MLRGPERRGPALGLSEWLFGLFSGMGDPGIVLCVFLLFLIDALFFPTLPELFMVLGFGANPTWEFALVLLGVAIVAELVGVFTLYFVVSRIKVPERISRIAKKYIGFLVVSDEKIILVNRVAPMIPFLGAFIAGLAACKAMVALVRRAKLRWFALYCLLVAVAIFIFA